MICWLVELKDTSKGVYWMARDGEVDHVLTADSAKAIRFCRKKDADDIIAMMDVGEVSHAVEHMWDE